MQKVSDSFRQAIKADNREIKGYVEITYAMGDNSGYYALSSPTAIRYGDTSEMFDGKRKCNKYATLENDYTLLDGSYFLPNYNIKNDNAGYVSENVFSNIDEFNINIKNDTLPWTTKGITFYFNDNVPVNFTITINGYDVYNITNNDKSIFQLMLDEETMVTYINIAITQMEYPNRRVRISEVDLGITNLYEGQDLVSFTTNEEIDLLMISTPTNEVTINLNNYDNQFDPINPKGIVQYLTEDCVIKPYIGILTDNGEEYVCMGTYYLTDWSSNSNGNVTINGKNLIHILKDLPLKSDGKLVNDDSEGSLGDGSINPRGAFWREGKTFSNYLNSLYPYKFDFEHKTFSLVISKLQKLFDLLQLLSLEKISPLYVNRDNIIIFKPMENNTVETINLTQLIEIPKFETTQTTNKVELITGGGPSDSALSSEPIIVSETTHTLMDNEEYFWVEYQKYANIFNTNLIYSSEDGATAELIDCTNWQSYIKVTGDIGSTVKLTIKSLGSNANNYSSPVTTFTNGNFLGNTISIDFSSKITAFSGFFEEITNYLFNNSKPYKISANYIGNPILEPGDTISIETKYGYKNMIITKQNLTFDGGLQGSIEGVGD